MSPEETQPTGPPPEVRHGRPRHRFHHRRGPVQSHPPRDKEAGGLLCDTMLGKLARELRLLGKDVEYNPKVTGMQAYRQAKASGRVFLTRTKKLSKLPGVLFIKSQLAAEQVAEVQAAPKIEPPSPDQVVPAPEQQEQRESAPGPRPEPEQPRQPKQQEPAFGRCLICNTPLEKISREQARPSIPFFVYQIHSDFRRCSKCRKVFWPGSHAQDMQQRTQAHGARRQQAPRLRYQQRRRQTD